MANQIFISYRRDGGVMAAKLLCETLKNRGYTVFFDYESLRSGPFDVRLFSEIEGCNDFLLVLPAGGLDRCTSEEDWVRKEIRHALLHEKNVIPVLLDGFEFPAPIRLPVDIRAITTCNGVSLRMDYFEAVIDKIESYLDPKTKPAKVRPARQKKVKRVKRPPTERQKRTRFYAIVYTLYAILAFLSLSYLVAGRFLFYDFFLYFVWIAWGLFILCGCLLPAMWAIICLFGKEKIKGVLLAALCLLTVFLSVLVFPWGNRPLGYARDGTGAVYAFYGNGAGYTVCSVDRGATDVTVLPSFDGLPVTAVDLKGASGLETLTLSLSESTKIRISDCKSLRELTFVNCSATLAEDSVRNCPALTEFSVEAATLTVGNLAFRDCPALSVLTLTDSTVTAEQKGASFVSILNDLNLTLDGSTLSGFSNRFLTVTLGGASAFESFRIGSAAAPTAETIVFLPDFDPEHGATENLLAETLYLSEKKHVAVAETVHVPKELKSLPENLFGEVFSSVTVCYGGSPSAWETVRIPTGGNGNYYEDRVTVVCDTPDGT